MDRAVPILLTHLTTDEARAVLEGDEPTVVLLPIGSAEPHGPHLPLGTDSVISEETCRRAAEALREQRVAAVVGPTVPYGVTDCAEEFAGAISLSSETVTRLTVELCHAFLRDGWRHVSIVNSHLEPAHVAALHAAVVDVNESGGGAPEGGIVPVSFPNVLSRRWGRTLTEEFKSGACHAGRYEGSLVLAVAPETVRADLMKSLPANPTSLSEALREGKQTFREMGGDRAYFGAPAEATADEGRDTYERLTRMVVTEVLEALGRDD